jgi:hypothetical protein
MALGLDKDVRLFIASFPKIPARRNAWAARRMGIVLTRDRLTKLSTSQPLSPPSAGETRSATSAPNRS